MNVIKIFIVKFKNYILLFIFFVSIYLGVKLNSLLVDFLVEEFYENNDWIGYIGLIINVLVICLIVYFSSSLISKIEENLINKLKKQIEIGYPKFIESLLTIKNLNNLPFFALHYTHLYRFIYEEFFIELKLTKEKLFEVFWYRKGTDELISKRTVSYKIESTIQAVLINGPFLKKSVLRDA